MKNLKIKRVLIYAIYNSLRNTPPKDYPTTGEIKTTINDILPALKPHADEYLKFMKRAEEIQMKFLAKEITKEESEKAVEPINLEWRAYTKEHGNDIVEVAIENEPFTTLKTQFDRDGEVWGKRWFANIEEFDEVSTSFTEAAKQFDN